MNRMSFNTTAVFLVALIVTWASSARAGAPTLVTDHVWNDGQNSVIWGPGNWTLDGQIIGTTFPNGVVQPGGIPSHDWDMIVLPVEPNDFHFDVEILLPQRPITMSFWFNWDLDMPGDIWVDVQTFSNTFTDNYSVMIDLTANSASVLDVTNQVELYNGSADPFIGNAPLPGDFIALGSSRSFHVPLPGTAILLGASAGMTLARRRR